MNRDEQDLRDALSSLEREADRAGAPPASDLILAAKGTASSPVRVLHNRWLPPLAAAALVAATVVAVTVTVSGSDDESTPVASAPSSSAAVTPSSSAAPSSSSAPSSSAAATPSSSATPSSTGSSPPRTATPGDSGASILDDAAAKLDVPWTAPAKDKFYFVRTTDARTWTSVSGRKTGLGRTSSGEPIAVPGCVGGQFTSGSGQAGACNLNDVSHYRADAPVSPGAWDQYLETIAPGAKAGGAQGKIIVQVLHQDLLSPRATAALLRYTATCPGLHTLSVKPVIGSKLVGVTCTSMTAGSYGLVFDASNREFRGFVVVNSSGQQDAPAEIVLRMGIVSRAGEKP